MTGSDDRYFPKLTSCHWSFFVENLRAVSVRESDSEMEVSNGVRWAFPPRLSRKCKLKLNPRGLAGQAREDVREPTLDRSNAVRQTC